MKQHGAYPSAHNLTNARRIPSRNMASSPAAQSPAEPTLLEFGLAPEARPGSSKRKRSGSRDGYAYAAYLNNSATTASQPTEPDSHTPKRSRQTEWPLTEQQQESAKDSSDIRNRSVRRKHGKYGLSSISQRQAQDGDTGSRFLEGSMNDKPSINPPSMFTRDISNHSLASNHSINVDHLMDQYHDDEEESRQSGDQRSSLHHQHSQFSPPPRLSMSPVKRFASPFGSPFASPEKYRPESPLAPTTVESKGSLYRFGRMVASTFNPANVWGSFSRTYKDTKEDMTLRNVEENRLKAQQKADAEAQYAAMKAAGHFAKTTYTVVGRAGTTPRVRVRDTPASGQMHEAHEAEDQLPFRQVQPRHSAHASLDESMASSIAPSRPSESTGPGSPAYPYPPGNGTFKSLKSRKSIFGIRAPSLSSLKRVRSEYNLLGLPHQSIDSLSPDKQEQTYATLTLPRSQSRRELGKQYKLSKRVSDLELKLADARRELSAAINNASPMPELPSRFEKFTPGKHTPTITSKFRSKFVPGRLPTLPSERLIYDEPPPPQRSPDHIMELFTPLARNSSIATQPPLDPDATSFPVPMTEAEFMGEKPLPERPVVYQEPTPSAPPAKTKPHHDRDARHKPLDQAVEGKPKRKGVKKRKSDYGDETESKPSEHVENNETGAPKKSKKRKSASKTELKAISDEPLPALPTLPTLPAVVQESTPVFTSEVADRTVNSLERASTRDTIHSDPLDPIFEEETVTSTTKHGSNMVLNVTHVNVRSTPRKSNGHTPATSRSASPEKKRATSPPPSNFSHVDDVNDEIVMATPGVGPIPDMPNVSVRGRKTRKTPKASIEKFQWPDDVF